MARPALYNDVASAYIRLMNATTKEAEVQDRKEWLDSMAARLGFDPVDFDELVDGLDRVSGGSVATGEWEGFDFDIDRLGVGPAVARVYADDDGSHLILFDMNRCVEYQMDFSESVPDRVVAAAIAEAVR